MDITPARKRSSGVFASLLDATEMKRKRVTEFTVATVCEGVASIRRSLTSLMDFTLGGESTPIRLQDSAGAENDGKPPSCRPGDESLTHYSLDVTEPLVSDTVEESAASDGTAV